MSDVPVSQFENCFPLYTSRFSGLMSLWTMLRPCRYLTALAKLNSMQPASRSVYLLDEVMASNRSPPFAQRARGETRLSDSETAFKMEPERETAFPDAWTYLD